MTVREAIRMLVDGRGLTRDQARQVAGLLMEGQATGPQIGALLTALRIRGETVDEICGFAQAIRAGMRRVPLPGDDLVDTCGTGGDGKGTFNVSTVSALVAAGAGCRVAKHGNRFVSGRCGSADLLEALGVAIHCSPEAAARSLEQAGIVFLYAPDHHPALGHVGQARREIGIRSIFNLLGPLCSPAGVRRQVIGVSEPALVGAVAEALRQLGCIHGLVVHGLEGLDEISIGGTTCVAELRDGAVRRFELTPEELGVARGTMGQLAGGDPQRSAQTAMEVLQGGGGAAREIVLANAGAAIYVAGRAPTLRQGVETARRSIDSGAALTALERLRRLSQADG